MLGRDQPVILQLLEISPALPALQGVVMELEDCAFPTLAGIEATDDPARAFRDAEYALLVGARPRGPGMERKDLLEANARIFSAQGKAINEQARREIRVLVVGNSQINRIVVSKIIERSCLKPVSETPVGAVRILPLGRRAWRCATRFLPRRCGPSLL